MVLQQYASTPMLQFGEDAEDVVKRTLLVANESGRTQRGGRAPVEGRRALPSLRGAGSGAEGVTLMDAGTATVLSKRLEPASCATRYAELRGTTTTLISAPSEAAPTEPTGEPGLAVRRRGPLLDFSEFFQSKPAQGGAAAPPPPTAAPARSLPAALAPKPVAATKPAAAPAPRPSQWLPLRRRRPRRRAQAPAAPQAFGRRRAQAAAAEAGRRRRAGGRRRRGGGAGGGGAAAGQPCGGMSTRRGARSACTA